MSPGERQHFPQRDFKWQVLHFPCILPAHTLLEVQWADQAKAQGKALTKGSRLGRN